MSELTLVEAVRCVLRRAMTDDETVVLLDEDIGADGGVKRSSALEKHSSNLDHGCRKSRDSLNC